MFKENLKYGIVDARIIALKKEKLVMRLMRPILIAVVVIGAFFVMGILAESASAYPVFARKYGTSCTTCHVAPPRLNAFGRVFRLNGYHWPGGDDKARKIKAVELGKPFFGARGTVDSVPPLAVWFDLRAQYNTKTPVQPITTDIAAESVDILTGGTLGDSLGYVLGLTIALDTGGNATLEHATLVYKALPSFVNIRIGRVFSGFLHTHNSNSLAYAASQGGGSMYRNGTNWTPLNFGQGHTGIDVYGIAMHKIHYQLSLSSGLGGGQALGDNNYQKQFTGFLEYQVFGINLDDAGGKAGTKHYEDNHIRIRALFSTGTNNTGTNLIPINEKRTSFGGELEAWWSMVQFLAGAVYTERKTESATGSSLYDKTKEFTLQAELNFLLMNGAIIPTIRYEAVNASVTASNGRWGGPSIGTQTMDIGALFQVRPNVQVRAGAVLELNASKLNNFDNTTVGGVNTGNHKTFRQFGLHVLVGY